MARAAYLAYRLPATFAAAAAVAGELADRRPDLRPRSLSDVGCGPGSASLAALALWAADPSHQRSSSPTINLVDFDRSMLDIAEKLVGSGVATEASVRASMVDLTRGPIPAADVVIAGYTLGEVPKERRSRAVRDMWQAARQACAIVEPGTPSGYAVILEATEELVRNEAEILSPAPSSWNCLAAATDWLHFAVRVSRSRLLRSVKGAELGHEDEKFCYVIASRQPGTTYAGRITRHPQSRAGHIRLTVCTAAGVKEVVVPRSRSRGLRIARHVEWGDALSAEELDDLENG